MQVRMRPNNTVKFLYPIIPSGINPSIGIGPTQGQRKTLTRVGFEPTTFGLDVTSHIPMASSRSGLVAQSVEQR